MGNKVKSVWFCTSCGNESPKWMGRCPACGEWNTMVEETVVTGKKSAVQEQHAVGSGSKPVPLSSVGFSGESRRSLNNAELDRVLGGGIVEGSLVLIGGEPGIGKSTLSLQIPLACPKMKTFYVTGEESVRQVKLRAARIGGDDSNCMIYSETLMENIIAEAEADAARAAESIRAVSSESLETIEGARRGLDDARDAFISSASEFFRSEYEKLLSSVKESYDGIRIDAEAMLEKVAGTLLETRETISILSEGETEKIADIVERLESLSGKIKSSESQLTALQEKITATKEEIFNAQQERGRLSNDIDQHQKTLQDMEQQLSDCRREMDEKKAEIVRLKVERDKISRTLQDKEDKAPDEKKSRFQDMIQEFPEDIFTGAVEDVDLSDEENS